MSKNLNLLSTDELYILIGKNVARLRKKANISQLELSLEMGNKSTSLISSAELYKNKRKFNIAQLQKIAKILNVDIKDFFEYTEYSDKTDS
ncbi:MAG: helix-turn-helix transcriptional regulator [Aliarcobacter sp.]|jgi:transcriptional regulator with XRE-family HTH domain|nr:helix-turn-helix transcriptional regulator [Aliarcobacter sp.]